MPDIKTINGIREGPLSNRAYEILRRRSGERRDGWVFPLRRSVAGHMKTLALKIRQARKKPGLPQKLVLYCGRHDFGTRLLKETGNLKLVMQAMGHVDTKTALKYQHPELEIVRSALDRTEPEWCSDAPSGPAMAHFTAHIENSIGV